MFFAATRLKKVVLGLFAFTLLTLSNMANAERSGEKIFYTYCVACHMSGVAGAPKLGSRADWQPHVDKSMETLLKNSISGIKAMPPRGMCSNCTDEEMQSTIQFMIDSTK
ncbi:cytochrome c5 family protein [Marinomonas sp. A79]|uniref:Cytochrome c5 family protein n=1 Tax=Marinomonas vulgaris TaxID=2823372 RepID=A0ABS5H745_9GAMM|nr:c-type cytochrome [Marinomonas vulgaris]MBR7887536.1 cytochrome c5 family protein [Marinomonas vulgaris]